MAKAHLPWCVIKYGCTVHKDVKHPGKRKYCAICVALGYGLVNPPDWPVG